MARLHPNPRVLLVLVVKRVFRLVAHRLVDMLVAHMVAQPQQVEVQPQQVVVVD